MGSKIKAKTNPKGAQSQMAQKYAKQILLQSLCPLWQVRVTLLMSTWQIDTWPFMSCRTRARSCKRRKDRDEDRSGDRCRGRRKDRIASGSSHDK